VIKAHFSNDEWLHFRIWAFGIQRGPSATPLKNPRIPVPRAKFNGIHRGTAAGVNPTVYDRPAEEQRFGVPQLL
jgi:hypothetical protein